MGQITRRFVFVSVSGINPPYQIRGVCGGIYKLFYEVFTQVSIRFVSKIVIKVVVQFVRTPSLMITLSALSEHMTQFAMTRVCDRRPGSIKGTRAKRGPGYPFWKFTPIISVFRPILRIFAVFLANFRGIFKNVSVFYIFLPILGVFWRNLAHFTLNYVFWKLIN